MNVFRVSVPRQACRQGDRPRRVASNRRFRLRIESAGRRSPSAGRVRRATLDVTDLIGELEVFVLDQPRHLSRA
jgi:hypothetical protein